MKLREIVVGALLTAMALIIPLAMGFLRIAVYPFTATLASHVPVLIAIIVGPVAAAMVGLGSAIGFLYALGPVIAARAAVHIVVGVAGAYLYRFGARATVAMLAVTPIHALGEALIVVPFGWALFRPGHPWYTWPAFVVGLGTIPHHLMDMIIAIGILALLRTSGLLREVRI